MTAQATPETDALAALAEHVMGAPPEDVFTLPGGGSDRGFFRLVRGEGPEDKPESVVGVIGRNQKENAALLGFTRHFAGQGLPVPRIHATDEAQGVYIMEDLGDLTLADQLTVWRTNPLGKAMALAALTRVVGWLPRFQVHGGQGLDYGLCYERAEMDSLVFEADIERFLMVYVARHVPTLRPPQRVIDDLDTLVVRLATVPREHFCYRDFQTRNIMWRDGPVFLDYQSGRLGALQYDLASFLYSPDTGLTEDQRTQLMEVYLTALADCGQSVERVSFLADFHLFVLARRLQALGAYGHLAKTRSPDYLKKIPPALADLRNLQQTGKLTLGLPNLEAWLAKLLTTMPEGV